MAGLYTCMVAGSEKCVTIHACSILLQALHAALPVADGKTKWVANFWLADQNQEK